MKDRTLYLLLASVLVLSLASYLGTLNSSFHLDDFHSIKGNPFIRDIGNIPKCFVVSGMASEQGKGYRPVVTSTTAINYYISGLDTWSYHLFNILFHLSCVVSLFFLSLHLFKKADIKPVFAVLSAALFAFHPVHTNAVSYIIARSALLCTFFYLTSFLAYIKFSESGRKAWVTLSAALFIMALLSKELAVTLPLILFAYELWVKKEKKPKKYLSLIIFLLINVAFVLSKAALLENDLGPGTSLTNPTPAALMAKLEAMAHYLKLFVFPINLNFYPVLRLPESVLDPAFLLSIAVLVLLAGYTLRLSRNSGLAAFCLAWFFITLLPETVANLWDIMIEYRLYLPSAGLAMLVALTAGRLWGPAPVQGKKLVLRILPLVLVATCFLVLTYERNKVYKDDITLWQDVVRKSPGSALAHSNLGESYFYSGMYKESIKEYLVAISIDPQLHGSNFSYCNLGWALEHTGNYEGALAAYKTGLAITPDDMMMLESFRSLSEKIGDPAETLRDAEIKSEHERLKAMSEGSGQN